MLTNKRSLCPLCLCAVLAACTAAAAQTAPAPGMWEMTMNIRGGPSRPEGQTASVCLTEAHLANPEQAMFDSMAAEASGRGAPPKCTLSNVQREGGNTRWSSACEGPRGPMNGVGAGTLGADAAQLAQSFEVSTPMGNMKLEQTLTARRTGNCP
jgi:Protein of unknown function (DUF3617)